MSDPINGEHPAFPCPYDGHFQRQHGMNFREHLAALAMQGFCANVASDAWPVAQLARYAVEQADALIAELNKPKP